MKMLRSLQLWVISYSVSRPLAFFFLEGLFLIRNFCHLRVSERGSLNHKKKKLSLPCWKSHYHELLKNCVGHSIEKHGNEEFHTKSVLL